MTPELEQDISNYVVEKFRRCINDCAQMASIATGNAGHAMHPILIETIMIIAKCVASVPRARQDDVLEQVQEQIKDGVRHYNHVVAKEKLAQRKG